MEKIKIGQIVNAQGIKGEVRVYNYSVPDRFDDLAEILTDDSQLRIEHVRYMGSMVILKLEGVDDRNGAEALKGQYVYITEQDLRPLAEGVYFIRDLIGMQVCLENGQTLGVLSDILQNTAQDLYEVALENGKKTLIPGVPEFIRQVDTEKRTITIRPIDGLLEL